MLFFYSQNSPSLSTMFCLPFFNSFCELIFPFIFLFPPGLMKRREDNTKTTTEEKTKKNAKQQNPKICAVLFGEFILICAGTFPSLVCCRTRGRILACGARSSRAASSNSAVFFFSSFFSALLLAKSHVSRSQKSACIRLWSVHVQQYNCAKMF